jgi:hypothetical protein
MRAWNIDGASMMTTPTGGWLTSPKVSKKWGIRLPLDIPVGECHDRARNSFYSVSSTGASAPVAASMASRQ